jgi:hypothetical protein
MSLGQTRSRDHDPCDEGGEAREQQQILQDDGHRKSPYAAPIAQSSFVAKATRQENRSKSFSRLPSSRHYNADARATSLLLNLSFTLHGRTTRATCGAMRESFLARSGVLLFAVTRIPCPRGLLGRATNPFAPVALASGPIGRNPF